jgi:hypothetical protein
MPPTATTGFVFRAATAASASTPRGARPGFVELAKIGPNAT